MRGLASERETLSLYGNTIGPDGAAALGAARASNSSLRILDLWRNGIGNEGARAPRG